jgi:dsDNA-specific endonuclease/ATPase MutS2
MSEPEQKVMEDEKKSISLNDLASLRNIVNVASRRGAFGAEEFEDVGKVFTKLDNFLKLQSKILEEQSNSLESLESGTITPVKCNPGGGNDSIEGGAQVGS